MDDRDIAATSISALELRNQLDMLQTERALALNAGLGDVPAYMTDLEEELEHWLHLYVIAGVTEIATLRGELFGMQLG